MSGAKLWDEFSPEPERADREAGRRRSAPVRFGMREFAAKGTQFTLNGRPIYLRGTLECSVWPLTGYPPTDVAAWQRIYRIMKSYGLNHIRFHSWCPPEAAFAAADIEGIMIQAEGPQANVPAGQDPARDAFIEAEFKRIVDTYGNHPSFCTMTLGNEYGGKDALLTALGGHADPARPAASVFVGLVRADDGQPAVDRTGRRAAASTGRARSATCASIVASDARPIIGHEIGQWMFFPDFNEMKKYTGVMAREELRDDPRRPGEEAPARPGPAVRPGQRPVRHAAVQGRDRGAAADAGLRGLFAAGPARLSRRKARPWSGRSTRSGTRRVLSRPRHYRRFCGPTVPLLRMAKRTFARRDRSRRRRTWPISAPPTWPASQPAWTIKDAQGPRSGRRASCRAVDVPTGKLTRWARSRPRWPRPPRRPSSP